MGKEKTMKRFLLATALFAFMASPALAASAKFTANVGSLALVKQAVTATADNWNDVLHGTIHTATPKDLLIGVSFQTSLFTETLVKSKGGTGDTSSADASIEIRVLVDGVVAAPGPVIYDRRMQQLSAKLGGYYANCADANGDGIIDVTTECDLLQEEIDLLLDTTAAHHFNFVKSNLGQGNHAIVVQSRITNSASFQSGSATATAVVGIGSLTVEEVMATNSPDGIDLQ